MTRLRRDLANRERSLPMIKHSASSGQMVILNNSLRCVAGMWLAMLPWCPASWAQASNQAPATAEEVKQLRDVVQSLLTRVTELENELKQRQASPTARMERDAFVAAVGPSAST